MEEIWWRSFCIYLVQMMRIIEENILNTAENILKQSKNLLTKTQRKHTKFKFWQAAHKSILLYKDEESPYSNVTDVLGKTQTFVLPLALGNSINSSCWCCPQFHHFGIFHMNSLITLCGNNIAAWFTSFYSLWKCSNGWWAPWKLNFLG